MLQEFRIQSSEPRIKTFIPFPLCFISRRSRGRIIDMAGFTILELIIVLFLITLILGLSIIFFANFLPSSRFNATTREMSATIRYARSLAQIHGERQIVTIDLDSKKYGVVGRNSKDIPHDINIKIIDPLSGEIQNGRYQIILNTIGGVEGGTIVLWNNKKTVSIQTDPVVGSVVVR